MNEIVKLENGEYGLVKDAVTTIVTIENEIKRLKECQDVYRERILKTMEDDNIVKIDIPELTIIRKEATTRETLDSKRLRAEHPDLYDEYVNLSNVKGSITIKLK